MLVAILAPPISLLLPRSPCAAQEAGSATLAKRLEENANLDRRQASALQNHAKGFEALLKGAREKAAAAPDSATRSTYLTLARKHEDTIREEEAEAEEMIRDAAVEDAQAARVRGGQPLEAPDGASKDLQDTVQSYKRAQADFLTVQRYLHEVEAEVVAAAPRFAALVGKPASGGTVEGWGEAAAPVTEAQASKYPQSTQSWARSRLAENDATFARLAESVGDYLTMEIHASLPDKYQTGKSHVVEHEREVLDELNVALKSARDSAPDLLWLLNTEESGLQVQILRAAAAEWSIAQAAASASVMKPLSDATYAAQEAIAAAFDTWAKTEDYNSARAHEDAAYLKLYADYSGKLAAICNQFDDASVEYVETLAGQLASIADRLGAYRSRLRDDIRRMHSQENLLASDAPVGQPVPSPQFEYGAHPWEQNLIEIRTPMPLGGLPNPDKSSDPILRSCGHLGRRGLVERLAPFSAVHAGGGDDISQHLSFSLPDGEIDAGVAEGRADTEQP